MAKTKITTKLIMSWCPCFDYTEAKIRKLIGRGVTALQVCDTDKISVSDRMWVLLHEEIIPAPALHELACKFAERALKVMIKAGPKPDPRSIAAIKAKRDWLEGKITDEELAAARDAARAAAWNAAWAAAWAAARDAARDAAWDAARDAAWAAAWAAARDAARDAAWAAARDAEQKKQLAIIRKVLQ